jgi:CubicO group peptidase (beta-lactamase class C family)
VPNTLGCGMTLHPTGDDAGAPPRARVVLEATRVEAGCRVARELTAGQRPPGLSVAVVNGDRAAWSHGFGFADVEARRPAAADTVFLWFSMTKIVTATAVVQLAERGALELDDQVGRWVPGFPADGGRVTVRHLLSHSAGLSNPIPVGWVRPADAPAGELNEFAARLLAKHSRLRGEPGARARYSNLGYLVLGQVIEAASGSRYTDYVRANVLAPLRMTSTDFAYRGKMTARAATGYHPRSGASTPLLRRMVPAGIFDHRTGKLWALARFCVEGAPYGGLIGSVEDAALFARLHLGVADARSRSVLSGDGVAEMQQLTARGRKLDVALGWFHRHADPHRGLRYWEHLGGGGGFFNTIRIYPDLNLGLVAMGNRTSWDYQRLADALTGSRATCGSRRSSASGTRHRRRRRCRPRSR